MWDLGGRYAAWRGADEQRPAHTCEATLLETPGHWNEHQLQAHWFAGHFGRDFLTLQGQPLRIIQFGTWNHQAGPDFAQTAVSFENRAPVQGCIELDTEDRDWERHGHATNPAYETVVLHLFLRRSSQEFFTRTARHRAVPQVLLNVHQLPQIPPNPLPEAKPGRCLGTLRALPEPRVRDILLQAASYRLQRKAAALATWSELHGPDEALYGALAATLGYRNNQLPFTLLAQRLPIRQLLREKSDAESLLFGMAGFLPAQDLSGFDPATRLYVRTLWARWWPRRAEFDRLQLAAGLWKHAGQRPANHPQRRLAALCQIARHWSRIRGLRGNCDLRAIRAVFRSLYSRYWQHHFTLASRASPKPLALIGPDRVADMAANVFFPFALAGAPELWPKLLEMPCPAPSRRAQITALRLFGATPPRWLRGVGYQQGLLQISEDFCMQDASDCLRCRFPEQVARW
jgi:hypothetical protein